MIEINAAADMAGYGITMTIVITIAAILTIAAISLALLLSIAVAAALGDQARQHLTFAPARQPVKLAVTVRPAGRRIDSPLPPI